jgi:hypothetical protein
MKHTTAKRTLNSGLDALEKELDNGITKLKEEHEAIKKRHEELLDRQDALTHKNGGDHTKPSDIIKLNIRGTEMFARRDTLMIVKGSRLEALFSGRWENQLFRDAQGRVFMDVDPCLFRKILECIW